jgi:hypothetical protein
VIAPVLVAAAAAGVALIVSGAQSHPPDPAPLPDRTYSVDVGALPPLAQPLATSGATVTARRDKHSAAPAACTETLARAHVVVPSLCLDGPVDRMDTSRDGALAIPADVHRVGIWSGGQQITDRDGAPLQHGTTLLAGHVNYVGQGNGAFYNLYRAKPGATVYLVDTAGHVTRWRITALDVVIKSALPKWLFAGTAGPRRLVLVTCGGPIIHVAGYGNTYRDNVIATAVPA